MDNKNNTPGYKMGVWIARLLWIIAFAFIATLGVAILASITKLLFWYLAFLF